MARLLRHSSCLCYDLLPKLFNKVDVARHEFALDWMQDFDAYAAALDADSSYAATLSRSLALVLDSFYTNLRSAGVSAVTGEGMEEMLQVCAHRLCICARVATYGRLWYTVWCSYTSRLLGPAVWSAPDACFASLMKHDSGGGDATSSWYP